MTFLRNLYELAVTLAVMAFLCTPLILQLLGY